MIQRIYIASDHAGFELKQAFMRNNSNLPWVDLGPESTDSVDYPDFAQKLCERMIADIGTHSNVEEAFNTGSVGILICGSGQGMAIKANRYPEIRAALCWHPDVAQLSRQHNNANVLCLGSRAIDPQTAQDTLKAFLESRFEGGRHSQRVAKLC